MSFLSLNFFNFLIHSFILSLSLSVDAEVPRLTAKQREDLAAEIATVGEEIMAQLKSNLWMHRDAGLTALIQMITQNPSSSQSILSGLEGFLLAALKSEKNANVFCRMIDLFLQILETLPSPDTKRQFARQSFTNCLTRMGDTQKKITQTLTNYILFCADPSILGPNLVSTLILPPAKMKINPWKPHFDRLQTLKELMDARGSESVNQESVLAYAIKQLASPNNTVRDEATAVIALLYSANPQRVVTQLDAAGLPQATVRKAKEACGIKVVVNAPQSAFPPELLHPGRAQNSSSPQRGSGGGGGGGMNSNMGGMRPQQSHQQGAINMNEPYPDPATAQQMMMAQQNAQGGMGGGGEEGDDEEDNWTYCEYCGMTNSRWKEQNVVDHQKKDCPCLYDCPKCKQIVKVDELTSHRLFHCNDPQGKPYYTECPRCKEGIERTHITAHVEKASCLKFRPEGAIRCPLCHVDLRLGDPAAAHNATDIDLNDPTQLIIAHLSKRPGCPSNPRTNRKWAQPIPPRNMGVGKRTAAAISAARPGRR